MTDQTKACDIVSIEEDEWYEELEEEGQCFQENDDDMKLKINFLGIFFCFFMVVDFCTGVSNWKFSF